MPNLNKVQLMGNITRDPEVRYTPKGTAVTDIGLAINRNYSTDDGDRREETTFVDITFWGRQAEVIGEYMKKGRPLYVEGRLQLDQWEDKNTGQQRSRLKVIGDNFQFLGGRDEGGQRGGGQGQQSSQQGAPQQQSQQSQQQAPTQQNYDPIPPSDDDDDIPF
ncbi:MAG: single-stranded DNA-binding protein [Verrucomicrobiales bacterium]|nr:single-stranded DNA-binding protein [Verrucomicrobiales bacterium]|tara:strand:- start:16280 stop:16768 length:489 start_codon:yes stop_codon:yes gene_type:complete